MWYSLQPPHSLETMMAEEMLHLVAKYKFALSIENGVCHDYITEKLWRPLISGSVPIYIGSPSVSVGVTLLNLPLTLPSCCLPAYRLNQSSVAFPYLPTFLFVLYPFLRHPQPTADSSTPLFLQLFNLTDFWQNLLSLLLTFYSSKHVWNLWSSANYEIHR